MQRPPAGKPPRRAPPARSPRAAGRRVGWVPLVSATVALLIVCSVLGGAVAGVLQGRGGDVDPGAAGDAGAEAANGEFERSLRDAVAADPADATALASLANLLANRGELPEAIDRYEEALALEPANGALRFDFATALTEAGQHPDAELQFGRLIEADPANLEARFYLAELYRDWRPPRTDEAVALYRGVAETAPDSYLGDRASEELGRLGAAPGSPAATAPGSPAADAATEEGTRR